MITRRRFFKRLGMIAGCAVIAPSISLERLQHPNFVPGQRLRNAGRYQNGHEYFARTKLNEWLKSKVPMGFRHGKKPEYITKSFDYGTQMGMVISYQSPRNYRKL